MADFEEFWRILCEAFPENEHRNREGQRALLENPIYRLDYIREGGRIVGFICTWDLGDRVFIEHLALDSPFRGKQLGSGVIRQMTTTSGKPLILEVELPETETARRRIRFYQSLGFHLNLFDYTQPPLQESCGSVPLYLMSWPDPLDEAEFSAVRKRLYGMVFGL